MEKYFLLIATYVLCHLEDYVNSQESSQLNSIAFGNQPNSFELQFTPNSQTIPSLLQQLGQFGLGQLINNISPNFLQSQVPYQFNPQGNIFNLQTTGNVPLQQQNLPISETNGFEQSTLQIPRQNNAFEPQSLAQTPQPLLALNLNSIEAQLWFSYLLIQLSNILNNTLTREGLIFLMDDLQKILSNVNFPNFLQLYTQRILQTLNQTNFIDNFDNMQ